MKTAMTIKIKMISNGLYTATCTPPGVVSEWSTITPLTSDRLIEELLHRGAHQTDIGDAFYAADPDWLTR